MATGRSVGRRLAGSVRANEQERDEPGAVVIRAIGLDTDSTMTLDAIALELGIPAADIGQVYTQALRVFAYLLPTISGWRVHQDGRYMQGHWVVDIGALRLLGVERVIIDALPDEIHTMGELCAAGVDCLPRTWAARRRTLSAVLNLWTGDEGPIPDVRREEIVAVAATA
jgi:hypothetical protein